MKKEIMWKRCDWFDEPEEHGEEEDEGYSDDYDRPHHGEPIKVHNLIQTPFGIARYDDRMSPIHDTEFYIGYTNFNLSKKVIDDIEKVEGVEYLKPMGRYRMIIGIGILFEAKTVCRDIEKKLGVIQEEEILSEDDLSDSVKTVINEIKELSNDSEFWSAYIFPNGKILFRKHNNHEEAQDSKNELAGLTEYSSGMVITSVK